MTAKLPRDAKPIPGFDGYLASKDGSIWSVRPCWRNGTTPRLQTQKIARNGYPLVGLRTNGRRVYKHTHSLILLTFRGPRPPGMQTRHLDGDQTNVCLSNLVWGTPKENAADRARHDAARKGRRWYSQLGEQRVADIRALFRRGIHVASLAEGYGVHIETIRDVVAGRTWKHCGTGRAS